MACEANPPGISKPPHVEAGNLIVDYSLSQWHEVGAGGSGLGLLKRVPTLLFAAVTASFRRVSSRAMRSLDGAEMSSTRTCLIPRNPLGWRPRRGDHGPRN